MDDKNPDLLDELTEDELAEAEKSSLFDEIAERWDPERLLKLVSKRAGKGQRLDLSTRQKYEGKLGADLSHVRVYTGEFAREVARQHRAEALTIGSTGMIVMGETADRSPASTEGEALLAHELTHVAQAQRGVHREETPGAPARPGSVEGESEAQASEDQVRQEAHGSVTQEAKPGDDTEVKKAELETKLIERVLQMIGDAEWVLRMRSGGETFRP